jgi:hypothetical protein
MSKFQYQARWWNSDANACFVEAVITTDVGFILTGEIEFIVNIYL